MSEDQRPRMLRAALQEFDRAHRARHRRRTVLAGCGAMALLVTAAWLAWFPSHRGGDATQATDAAPTVDAPMPVAWRLSGPQARLQPVAAPRLPEVLEVIQSDRALSQALEAAGSADGFVREGNRVFILPRAASPALAQPSADAGQGPSAAASSHGRDLGVPRSSPG